MSRNHPRTEDCDCCGIRQCTTPRIQRHPGARVVEGLFRTVAARIGSVPAGSEIPRAVRSQQWSPMNAPMIWSASSSADSTPALDWLIMAAGRIVEAINLHEGRMPAHRLVGIASSLPHRKTRPFDSLVAADKVSQGPIKGRQTRGWKVDGVGFACMTGCRSRALTKLRKRVSSAGQVFACKAENHRCQVGTQG